MSGQRPPNEGPSRSHTRSAPPAGAGVPIPVSGNFYPQQYAPPYQYQYFQPGYGAPMIVGSPGAMMPGMPPGAMRPVMPPQQPQQPPAAKVPSKQSTPAKSARRAPIQIVNPKTNQPIVIPSPKLEKRTAPESAAPPGQPSTPLRPEAAALAPTPVTPTAASKPAASGEATPKREKKPLKIVKPGESTEVKPPVKAEEKPAPVKPAPEKKAPEPATAKKEITPEPVAKSVEATPAPTEAAPSADAVAPAEASEEDDEAEEEEEEEVAVSSLRRVLMNVPYEDSQWSPTNQAGAKCYTLEFLKQFQPLVQDRPTDLPPGLEKILGAAHNRPTTKSNKAKSNKLTPSWVSSGKGGKPPKVINLPKAVVKPLETNENAWKAHNVKNVDLDEKDTILKKAQGILNRLTVEKFEKLSDQLVDSGVQLPDSHMAEFIGKVFSKALDEPFFSEMYARLCKKMSVIKNESGELKLPEFRKLLLNRCQKEFEKDRSAEADAASGARDYKPDPEKSEEENKKAEREWKADEDYKLATEKRHMLGNVKFIGELFKLHMVRPGIIHSECVGRLLTDDADEDVLECLCKLLETAGQQLETPNQKGKNAKETQQLAEKARKIVAEYMDRLEKITRRKGLSSRVKFMIQDLFDLRKRNWVARRDTGGPKTIEEVRAQAKADQLKKAAAASNFNPRDNDRRGGRGDRRSSRDRSMFAGRKSQQSEGWTTVAAPPRVKIDKNKVGFAKEKDSGAGGDVRLGPSRKKWGNKSGGSEPAGGVVDGKYVPRNRFAGLLEDGDMGSTSPKPPRKPAPEVAEEEEEEETKFTDEQMINKNKGTLEEYMELKDSKEVVECLKELDCKKGIALFVQQSVLFGLNGKKTQVETICALFKDLFTNGILTAEIFEAGFDEPLELLDDLSIDVPMAFDLMASFLATGIVAEKLTTEVFIKEFMSTLPGENGLKLVLKTLKAVRSQSTEEKMIQVAQQLPKPLKDFLPEHCRHSGSFERLTQREDLQVLDSLASSSAEGTNGGVNPAEVLAGTIELGLTQLMEDNKSHQDIMAWIQEKVPAKDLKTPAFMRALVGTIMQAITKATTCKSADYSFTESDVEEEQKRAKDSCLIIKKYANVGAPEEEQLQLHAICSVQGFCAKNEFPNGMVDRWLAYLYEDADIPEPAFLAWETEVEVSKSKLYGGSKGAALQQAEEFLTMLKEDEDED